jgi:hypothetical protein
MISRDEAQRIAEKWVSGAMPAGASPSLEIHEFDLGYVVAVELPDKTLGLGRGVIDRATGELSVWPSLPVDTVIAQYQAKQATHPARLWTWDPSEQARWDLRHVATPSNVSHLHMPDRTVTARSVKGDREPQHHRLVQEFFRTGLAAEYRERGYDRCSEAAAISDALHAEDARRQSVGEALITLDEARTGLFAGSDMVTYRVRESGDPVAGTTTPPCLSCALLLRHFGFQLRPPADLAGESTSEGASNDA